MAADPTGPYRVPPSGLERLVEWVRAAVELTAPDRVVWADGSDDEWARLSSALVAAGTFTCPEQTGSGVGSTDNAADPVEVQAIPEEMFRGAMRGRTMYVVPFCTGRSDGRTPTLGVQVTDSEYVVASMRIMARTGASVLPLFEGPAGDRFLPCLHSQGAPLRPDRATAYISYFPGSREVWSLGPGSDESDALMRRLGEWWAGRPADRTEA